MVEFKSVSYGFPGKPILIDASFSFEEGRRYLLQAPSGSGKTTILHLILGWDLSFSGEIFIQGTSLSKKNVFGLRKRLLYLGQESPLTGENVKDALLAPFTYKSNSEPVGSLEGALDGLGLDADILRKSTENLSGGERQRIAAARSFLLDRDMYILDEPTASLDEESAAALLRKFSDQRKTLLMVSHSKQAVEFVDEVIELKEGKLWKR
jgi:putative ABC transport system ATP-binding protein